MKYPRVSIIIINWNGWKDTIECLESVYQIDYPNFDVIVVDNNSLDDSLEKIKEYSSGKLLVESDFFCYKAENKPLHIAEYMEDETLSNIKGPDLIIIKNKGNLGFPGGNNIGINFALKHYAPNYLLLLNNDTVVHPGFLTELILEGEYNKDVGILGPKIYYYDNPDVIWSAGCKISWKLARGM